jgi:hypothetical protein
MAEVFEAGHPRNSSSLKNNQRTWKLANILTQSRIFDDTKTESDAAAQLRAHIAANIGDDGATYDFFERDALHYQSYDLLAFLRIALLAPDLLSKSDMARLRRGVEYLRPFYLGEREHIEFVHTKIALDAARRDDGAPDYQNLPWDPQGAEELLRLARVIFPDVRDWTQELDDGGYTLLLKVVLSLKGEVVGD